MFPLVYIGTVLTHLTGGSAGREGTALQMSAAIFSKFFQFYDKVRSRLFAGLEKEMRRNMLVASLASGFSGIFGVPVTGALFAVEVLSLGTVEISTTFMPAIVGSFTADWACRWFNKYVLAFEGHSHLECTVCLRGTGATNISTPVPQSWEEFQNYTELLAIIPAGCAFGLCAWAFEELLGCFKTGLSAVAKYTRGCDALAKPCIGGIVVILLWLFLCVFGTTPSLNMSPTYDGTDPKEYTFAESYLGLGVDSPGESISTCFTEVDGLNSPGVHLYTFFLKMLFVTITLGAGFKGGEVTPIFFIGAALGNRIGALLGQDTQLFAALGYVSVFAGATNTPLACTAMAVELFGGAKIFCYMLSCSIAYMFSNFRQVGGIYQAPVNDPRPVGTLISDP